MNVSIDEYKKLKLVGSPVMVDEDDDELEDSEEEDISFEEYEEAIEEMKAWNRTKVSLTKIKEFI